ncbi:hypothetical protein [Nostoc sp.]
MPKLLNWNKLLLNADVIMNTKDLSKLLALKQHGICSILAAWLLI